MYKKTIWLDQVIEKPKTYEISENNDGTSTLLDAFGEVTELGTPVNANNMNHIEEGIENNDARITLLENSARTAIGDPVITLANSLEENEIWLEGAEVSKTTYALLYEIYGDTYGTAESEDNFILPDFRDRAIWGASDFGYLEAGLPNITGMATIGGAQLFYGTSGALYSAGTISAANTGHSAQTTTAVKLGFNATKSSSIYGASTTVQPPSIKVRVKTRYA